MLHGNQVLVTPKEVPVCRIQPRMRLQFKVLGVGNGADYHRWVIKHHDGVYITGNDLLSDSGMVTEHLCSSQPSRSSHYVMLHHNVYTLG